MDLFMKALSWVGGLLLASSGLILSFSSSVTGVLLISAALLVLPPVRAYVYARSQRQLSFDLRCSFVILLVLAGVVAFFVSSAQNIASQNKLQAQQALEAQTAEFNANKSTILLQLEQTIHREQFNLALSQIQPFKEVQDDELQSLIAAAQAGQTLQDNLDRIAQLETEIKQVTDPNRLAIIYGQLKTLDPNKAEYATSYNHYEKIAAINKDIAEAATARKNHIQEQFSAWDGSHMQLTRIIKDAMNDPDSYEHIETRYSDEGQYIIVTTHYRGRNGFGALVRGTVKAKVGLMGTVLTILEQK